MPQNGLPAAVFPWFALTVKPRHEKSSAAALRAKGFEEFVPLHRARRRWSDRIAEVELPLLPGYVFCRFEPEKRLPVISSPGITGVVAFGKALAPIAEDEIAALRRVVASGLNAEPWPYLEIGEHARILEGPLKGIEGVLLEIKRQCRVVLSVTLLQRSVAVEVDRRWLERIRGAANAA